MKNDTYETIIIGAGIGGMICGCYLAKKGQKILIIDQSDAVGGYCSGFVRNDYYFDTGVHYLGGVRNGLLGEILGELEILSDVSFNAFDPTDTIITNEARVNIRQNYNDTISEFLELFQDESVGIKNFFSFILMNDLHIIYMKTKRISFSQILDLHFKNSELKRIFKILVEGNLGSGLNQVPAYIGIELWREYLFDPGYYPEGGIIEFTKAIEEKIIMHGGSFLLSEKVNKIQICETSSKYVFTNKNNVFEAENLVANIDPFQLSKLMNITIPDIAKNIDFTPTPSAVALYIGLDQKANKILNDASCVWDYSNNINNNAHSHHSIRAGALIFSPSDHNSKHTNNGTIQMHCLVPSFNLEYWEHNQDEWRTFMKNKLQKYIPDLNDHIMLEVFATPQTFQKYTLNEGGAILGRKLSMQNKKRNHLFISNKIKKMYFTGSWYSYGGVSEVAISGKRTARILLEHQ